VVIRRRTLGLHDSISQALLRVNKMKTQISMMKKRKVRCLFKKELTLNKLKKNRGAEKMPESSKLS